MMKRFTSMAYSSADEMMFGTAKYPVETKRGLKLGSGYVIPEIVPHPRPGSEKTIKTLLREFERANGDALERCVIVGHPALMVENETYLPDDQHSGVGWGHRGANRAPDG